MQLPTRRRGLMFVLSSPSGAGKTTLSRRLLERYPSNESGQLTLSVSVTTRTKRPGEVEGKDYFFTNRETFDAMAVNGDLLEYAQVFEHGYGTPKSFVEKALTAGIDVLFDIDWQGTRQLAQKSREDLVSVFILPPSMKELERRLKERAQDSDEIVRKRMSKASSEISHWEEYDYVLVNNDLDETLSSIIKILEAERLKRKRQVDLAGFVQRLCES